MAFNLQAFGAGFAKKVTADLDDERDRMNRLADQETSIATQQRLAKKASREAEQKLADEAVEALKFLNYKDDDVANIAGQGKFAVQEAIRYGTLARDQGKDISEIYGVVDSLSEVGEVVEGADVADITTGEMTTSEQTDKAVYGFKRDALKELLNPDLKDKVQASLDGAYAVAVQKGMNATNVEEKERYESKASQLLTKIKEKAGEKDTGRAFSEGTISDNFRSARKTAYLKMDFALDKEGEIKQGQMARIAEFNIAELSAAKELYATNYDNNTNSEVDSMMGNRIKQMSRAANKGLQQYGRRIANGNIDNVVEKDKLIGAKLIAGDENNKYTIESYSPIPIDDVRANAKKGVYKAGDVVIVQEKDNTGATITRIKVYTGLEQYSANHNMFIDAGEI
jgi:hypothetical protein